MTRKNTEGTKKMNGQFRDLSNSVLALSARIDHLEKTQAQERQLLVLQVQNILLRHGIDPGEVGKLTPPAPSPN